MRELSLDIKVTDSSARHHAPVDAETLLSETVYTYTFHGEGDLTLEMKPAFPKHNTTFYTITRLEGLFGVTWS